MFSFKSNLRPLAEIALIFAIFAWQAGTPAPDVNEAHYLGKAIHFWNPDTWRGDLFMESPDTHKVFFFTFGWLSLWLSPVAFAWTGRVLTWLLLAWAWRRLSWSMIPRPWHSILTAGLFACLMERCHMAGEWVIGGFEAKGFAYVLVFLGLESLVRNRWNRALLFFGGASAFHVLVGGWSIVATGIAWLWLACWNQRPQRGNATLAGNLPDIPRLASLWPGVVGAILLALPGIIPAVLLDWGADAKTLNQAHSIYVFERLPHHLLLSGMRVDFIVRLAILWLLWCVWGRIAAQTELTRRLRAWVVGTVAITAVGVAIHLLLFVDRDMAAGLLRYYWFRMTDVALPLAVALELGMWLACPRWAWSGKSEGMPNAMTEPGMDGKAVAGGAALRLTHPTDLTHATEMARGTNWLRAGLLLAACGVVVWHVADHVAARMKPQVPRSFKSADYPAWREMCDWIVHSQKIPPDAIFITPWLSQMFKWDTGHAEVAMWKDEPQDARGLVEWRRRIEELYASHLEPPASRWHRSPTDLGTERVRELAAKYHADFVLVPVPVIIPPTAENPNPPQPPPPLELPEVYRNRSYIIYRVQ